MPRWAQQGGPRADAEPADALPTIRPGRDPVPTRCARCGSAWLIAEPPLGSHPRGLLWCQLCSRPVAWISAPLRSARRQEVLQTAPPWGPSPTAGDRRQEPAARSASPPLPATCGRDCRQERVVVVGGANGHQGAQWRSYHDAATHERALASQLDAVREQLERLTALCLTAVLPRLSSPEPVVRTGSLVVDLESRRALVSGSPCHLTRIEWLLLACLAYRLDAVVAHAALDAAMMPGSGLLATPVWGRHELHRVRVHVQRLRHKLEPAGDLIESVTGQGYRLRAEEEQS